MTIEKQLNGKTLTVKVSGRLDTTTAPDLDKELKSSMEGVEELILDCAGLEYISSAGLRVILSALKVMNVQGSMKLISVNDTIMDIFDVTGFSDILTIE